MNRRKEEMEKEKLWEIEKEGGDTGRKKEKRLEETKKRYLFKKKGGGRKTGRDGKRES